MTAPDLDADTRPPRAFRIDRLTAFAFRAPVAAPVAASFGVMRDRPAVFLKVEDRDGCFGWGEVFANWPAAGAEHRANLLLQDIAPLVLGVAFDSPEAMQAELERRVRIRALQCGEPGPFRQCVAALDQAAWDLVARRAGLPVHRMIRAGAPAEVPTYASGVHVQDGATLAPGLAARGFDRIKFKIGFDHRADLRALEMAASALPAGHGFMLDANQAWEVADAAERIAELASLSPVWMEEPIAADSNAEDWLRLARGTRIPLAAGENIAGDRDFRAAIELGALGVIQPDIAKWGGLSGNLRVAAHAAERGLTLCPHFLGGGIGLIASAHFLAAAGGAGRLEVDANPNPLRDAFIHGRLDGRAMFQLGVEPGFGIVDVPGEIARFQSFRGEAA